MWMTTCLSEARAGPSPPPRVELGDCRIVPWFRGLGCGDPQGRVRSDLAPGTQPRSPSRRPGADVSGDTTPCRMPGVTLHSHVRYKEIGPHIILHGVVSPEEPTLAADIFVSFLILKKQGGCFENPGLL